MEVVFNKPPLYIKLNENNFYHFDFDKGRTTGWAFDTDDIGIALAIISNSRYADEPKLLTLQLKQRQLRKVDIREVIYWISGGNKEWQHGEFYRYDFNKTYEDIFKNYGLDILKQIQKSKTFQDILNVYEEYDKSFWFTEALVRGYDMQSEEDEEEQELIKQNEELQEEYDEYIVEYVRNNYMYKNWEEISAELKKEIELMISSNQYQPEGIEYDYNNIPKKVKKAISDIESHTIKMKLKNGGDISRSNRDLFNGWVNVYLKHPQSTNYYYQEKIYAKDETFTQIKDKVHKKLMSLGDNDKFLNTFVFRVEKS